MPDIIIPLTLPQKDIYYEQMLYPALPIYNIGAKILIHGTLDKVLFEQAFWQLIEENETFRSVLVLENDIPFLKVLTDHGSKLNVIDYSDAENAEEHCELFINSEFSISFKLHSGELLNRFYLLKLQEDLYCLFTKCHHLIADGWGTSIMFQRFTEIYNRLITGIPPTFQSYSYLDFVEDDKKYQISDAFKESAEYWKNKLTPLPGTVIAPLKPSPVHSELPQSDHEELWIDRALFDQLVSAAKDAQVSVFHIFLSALYSYFGRMHANTDFAIGVPILNRPSAIFKKVVGVFAGIIPLRINFNLEASFYDLIKLIKNELRQSYRHQRFPLGKMISNMKLGRAQRQQLFDITLSYEKHNYSENFYGTQTNVMPLSHRHERVPLAIYVREFDDRKAVRMDFDFNAKFYTGNLIRQVITHFQALLKVISNADAWNLPICDIDFTDNNELQNILVEFNNTAVNYNKRSTFLTLFKQQVKINPHKTAVSAQENIFTYKELDRRSDQMAVFLIDQHKVLKGDVIALMTGRSAERLIAILGIMKAGCVYMPVDETFPYERIAYCIETAGAKLLLTDNLTLENNPGFVFKNARNGLIPEAMSYSYAGIKEVPTTGEDLAYIMFTSGSTGKPKGVAIRHQSLNNFIVSMAATPCFNPNDTLLAVTTFIFDISLLELLVPLCCGGRVIITDHKKIVDPALLQNEIDKYQPDIMQATPGLWGMLAENGWLGHYKLKVLSGGERLPVKTAKFLLNNCAQLWNMYGPTETTIWSTVKRLYHEEDVSNIGKPINNTRIYIIDKKGRPVPIGATGEMLIGGDGVALGYCNNAVITSERFIANPFISDTILYKTGDLASWLPHGDIELKGRIDQQIKFRGYRIELNEIEYELNAHPFIRQAVVSLKTTNEGQSFLVAHILAEQFNRADVITHLKRTLPDYMIPYHYITVSEFPYNSSGKIDRNALAVATATLNEEKVIVTPYDHSEEIILAIWAKLFSKNDISVTDNFFELGGHSLMVTSFINLLRRETGFSLEFRDVFDYPVIRDLATRLKVSGFSNFEPVQYSAGITCFDATPAQKRMWILSQTPDGSLAYNISASFVIDGALDAEVVRNVFSTLTERHEVLRTSFEFTGESLLQRIIPSGEVKPFFEIVDLSFEKEPDIVAAELIKVESGVTFNLQEAPLIKATLFNIAINKWIMLF